MITKNNSAISRKIKNVKINNFYLALIEKKMMWDFFGTEEVF